MRVVSIKTNARFEKRYRKLPRSVKESAKEKERLFREHPFHPSLETHKLNGKDRAVWAFSVNRKYRIKFIFLMDGHVLFLDIGTHDEVYR